MHDRLALELMLLVSIAWAVLGLYIFWRILKMATVKFTVNLTINGAPLLVVSDPLALSGTAGQSLSALLANNVSGGVPPEKFSVTNGSLPAGVSLNPDTGELSGTPTAAGTTTFEVSVSDSGA